MKKQLLLLVMMLLPMVAGAENTGTTEVVTLTTKGQLQSSLLDLETDYISSLTIKGPINGKDIQYLRSGIGKLSKLEELNLSDVELVADEEPYCVITTPVDGTFQHVQYTYYISDRNSEVYLGVSSISMAATSLYRCTSNRLDQLFNESEVGKTLKKVTMPRNFTAIGEGSFKRTSVEIVVMESPLREIGASAFYISQIKKVESDWSQLDNIGSSAFGYANSFAGNKEDNTLDISRLDSIPYNAFMGCNIKKVVLSPSLWYVGDGALCCEGLEEANVPSTLEHLWYGSFSSNSPFFKNLPVEDHIVYLGKFALCAKGINSSTPLIFKDGTAYIVNNFQIISEKWSDPAAQYITDIVFPSSLKRIGEDAFSANRDCYYMTVKSVAFPEGLEEIGENAFYKLDNLEKVSFPSTLKKIGRSAFEGCGLLKVVIPEAVTEIERDAFLQCNSLQSAEFYAKHVYDGDGWHDGIMGNCSSLEKVTIGPKVEVIPQSMCSGCRQLIKVDFMNRDASAGKLQINEYAFAGCKMEEVVLPEGLDSIGENAFSQCKYLSSLNLPNSLTRIGFDAFYCCTKLKTLTIPQNIKKICDKSNNGLGNGGPFSGCTALESLIINSEESFEWTNQNLLALKEVTFGSNVKTINERAFYNMATIKKVNFSEGLETIGSSAFSGCGAITSLSLPTSLKSIGSGAFLGCESLSSPIVLPMNLISLGSSAFRSCTNLPAIAFPEGLETIGNGTFSKCTAITEITIPKDVVSIGDEAFFGCTGLASLSLNENLKSIGNYAFYGCTGLTEVELKDNVETIGNYAFCGCTNIKTFFLGKSVTSIGESAFKRCGNLMSVYCYALEIPSVGFLAFQDSNLDNAVLYVSKGSKEKYKKAYGWSQFKNIVEMKMPEHTLTYIVDGEVYKTYSIEEGETITPEPAPTKEGYAFSGWSDIPKTMPANDVTITGSFTQIDFEIGNVTYEVLGDEISIKKGDKCSGDVEILSTVVINDKTYTITSIADDAFRNNTNITSVTISESVTNIGANAFDGCYQLSSIIIGKAVSAIGSKAFANLTSAALTRGANSFNVSCFAENIPTTASDAFENTSISNATLLVYDNSVSLYKASAPWNGFGTIMGFEEAAGIDGVILDSNGKVKIFSIEGKSLNELQKGLNIIQMSHGKTRKVIVK